MAVLSIALQNYINYWLTICMIKNLLNNGYSIFIQTIFYMNKTFLGSPLPKKNPRCALVFLIKT